VVTPIDDGGEVAIIHDVTHFKALDQLKNEFIATTSHDLKNPIFAVLGYSDLLGKAGPLTPMQVDFVNRIRNSAVQMQDLVLNLLEMARMDMGTRLKLEILDVGELVKGVVEEFKNQADGKKITLTTDALNGLPLIQGDHHRLQQVTRNLVSNAIKYTPSGGKVHVFAQMGANQILVYVRDTGIGIPPEALPKLFQKFFRVQTDATKDIEGNGLGLAIVKSIVEQHGGQVTVESTLGQGSCFCFTLPTMA
jgi:two-component system phosphate regulon sensor histidine kinase PhoR